MALRKHKIVTIIGGGLSGLTSALLLNRAGFEVTLVEKKTYPFHRVCGEYISNEIVPFLQTLDIKPSDFYASSINRLAISSVSGETYSTGLDLGGFGISRYIFDEFLFLKAKTEGVNCIQGVKVNELTFRDNIFETLLADGTTLRSDFVVSAHGKRSNLDRQRSFFHHKSPYLGVKYHIKTDFPIDLVQLDNFEGGYCGTVKIEHDRYNLCYLSQTYLLKKHGTLNELEEEVLFKNPFLKERFLNADFLNEKPEVINEISFEKKPLVENHILYCGDAAGMISPLCGNGMAMAIHSAKILSQSIIEHCGNRQALEASYEIKWNNLFKNRLLIGRVSQQLFGSRSISKLAVKGLNMVPRLSQLIIKRTHGHPF
ncbi:NAD(P)/FAD-dependent oxidoreductase [Paradesertivirga mongoliensis]|uniref:NAD(P)/FAD-dependent oxidoreductase n=1 Tax=Paradesertivirga mongoliensis TaxID=2100740 RepID=A0ABW4ZIC2_9SPHI|nr:NAD(P)/FAD-dependent oxidoreductase [Pedobacter mongoliensis]